MPRNTLTREQIVHAAIELLDAEGLEAFSMRALGQRLGAAATAVYWHVENKDHLVTLAGNEVWNAIKLPDIGGGDWRTAATKMATDLHAMLTRHPWLVQGFSSGSHLLYGSGKARFDDHHLALYEKAGFVGTEADRATATVFMFVLGSALGAAASVGLKRRQSRDGGDVEARMKEIVARASEIAKQFPRLAARVKRGRAARHGAAPDRSFEFGLCAILDGLETRLISLRR